MRKLTPILAITTIICLSVQAWHPVFAGTWRDDFEDKDTREWKIFNIDRQVEKWWVSNGEAVGEIFLPGFMSLWITGELTWKNYSFSCRAKLVEDKNEPPSIGLTLHDRGEEDTRYLFFIDYVFGNARIVKALPDDWSSVIFAFDAQIDTWYELTAAVHEDGTLEFKVNDEVFSIIDDDPLKGGQAGLVIADGQAHFDDVEITGPNIKNGGPGRARPVNPKTKLATTWGQLKTGNPIR
ncbi:hypothetical protein F4X88_08235 [Candidatus Poribacteria bacterium]|nr:hypothetical protein [Candidatus Poribacteria bacterium]MYA56267.1 hypothetical protein [Candidatus Poribacteria bacterium]